MSRIGIFDSGIKIVTTGLVFWVDASQLRSYSGTGTIWTDLTTNANNITLTNGPTFTSSDGGAIVFDGVDDYGGFSTVTGLNNTLSSNEVWIKHSAPTNGLNNQIIARTNTTANTFNILKNASNVWAATMRDAGDVLRNVVTTTAATTNWTHLVSTFDGSTFSVYINGSFANSGSFSTTINTTGTPTFRLMQNTTAAASVPGSLAIARIYNRGLTATEVLQNYNAEKPRFGL